MEQAPPAPDAITTWKDFTRLVRSRGCHLLRRLDEFPHAVLVAGCQRSGTTILARVITQSAGMVNYWFGDDDELDAALILSGSIAHTPSGRYCFQTTFVDECYREYLEHPGPFQIAWVIRNPHSVVYSLLYNWTPIGLDGTFAKCGAFQLTGIKKYLYQWFGMKALPRVERACYLYTAKTRQLFDLFQALGPERLFIVDYDELVTHKETVLPQIYDFIKLDYNPTYCQQIHSKSVDKKSKLSASENAAITRIAEPIYRQAFDLKNKHMPAIAA
jgi:hypothetical protein